MVSIGKGSKYQDKFISVILCTDDVFELGITRWPQDRHLRCDRYMRSIPIYGSVRD